MAENAALPLLALQALKRGEPILIPTDTVYGLALSVRDAESPEILYQLKKRTVRKPVAWLVSGVEDLTTYGKVVPELAQALARTFWPGPLTIIVKASDAVPEAFRSAEGTIGMRMPADPIALSLIRELGCPLATTSANISGHKPPKTFDQVDQALVDAVAVAVDDQDPEAKSGIASTIVNCITGHPEIMRVGAITIEDIQALS